MSLEYWARLTFSFFYIEGKRGAEGANLKLNSDGAAGQQLLNNTLSGCARLYPTHYRCRQQQWDLQVFECQEEEKSTKEGESKLRCPLRITDRALQMNGAGLLNFGLLLSH